ncbi:hypothetical protein CTRI78_v006403 [Colletotrichum trifolii]|uniref:Uncharacterized protein n=1 Tax=Colletotrichum trifolii TaxID=5466 RepID=A0A4R8RCI8_COLTR|nr:hypothetical protein CTRI78_v006403 [Colletotrichum trifolii]
MSPPAQLTKTNSGQRQRSLTLDEARRITLAFRNCSTLLHWSNNSTLRCPRSNSLPGPKSSTRHVSRSSTLRSRCNSSRAGRRRPPTPRVRVPTVMGSAGLYPSADGRPNSGGATRLPSDEMELRALC